MPPTPREVFLQLVWGVSEGRWDELPELYAEQTRVEHPFSPLGDKPLRNREELRKHFSAGRLLPPLHQEPADITVHETTDPEVIIAEFAYRGTVENGEPFRVPCIFVLRVRDGKIIASRDYIDHISSARRRGLLDELIEAIRA
ncbi:nuclear transport factor 2 family protein [Actinomadura graeca]|uniref:Nuclear transport factor 2 family protein n=1 Tax=Actinomadura graeca TaxID=2750812 RepID=A0ABX8QM32_9ACTN|nr:nuclear transport factor 2 family protein [Actinomadura graeca]QXJ19754.1 nuclear transport factor 2 family protein [Actinomadura graeca]